MKRKYLVVFLFISVISISYLLFLLQYSGISPTWYYVYLGETNLTNKLFRAKFKKKVYESLDFYIKDKIILPKDYKIEVKIEIITKNKTYEDKIILNHNDINDRIKSLEVNGYKNKFFIHFSEFNINKKFFFTESEIKFELKQSKPIPTHISLFAIDVRSLIKEEKGRFYMLSDGRKISYEEYNKLLGIGDNR